MSTYKSECGSVGLYWPVKLTISSQPAMVVVGHDRGFLNIVYPIHFKLVHPVFRPDVHMIAYASIPCHAR